MDHMNEFFILNVTSLLSVTLKATQSFKFHLSISLLVTASVLLCTVLGMEFFNIISPNSLVLE